jgi:hypothetical protein
MLPFPGSPSFYTIPSLPAQTTQRAPSPTPSAPSLTTSAPSLTTSTPAHPPTHQYTRTAWPAAKARSPPRPAARPMPRLDTIEMADLLSSGSSGDSSGGKYTTNGPLQVQGSSTRRRSVASAAGVNVRTGELTAAENRLAEREFWRKVLINTALIGSW